jgi:Domain of unknown function (DUF4032)
VFHEVLEHRWFLSEQAGKEVGTMEAARAYVETVLGSKPDEKLALPTITTGIIPAISESDPDEPTSRTVPLDATTIKQAAGTKKRPRNDT